MIILNFQKIHEDAIIPTRNYETDAGIDFYAIEEKMIYPGTVRIIKTGLVWNPQFEYKYIENNIQDHFNIYMKITDRSGIASKTNLHVKAGVIDQTYRGEIGIVIQNCGNRISGSDFEKIKKGQKIAQGIVDVLPKTSINKVENIYKETDRSDKGFGSSG